MLRLGVARVQRRAEVDVHDSSSTVVPGVDLRWRLVQSLSGEAEDSRLVEVQLDIGAEGAALTGISELLEEGFDERGLYEDVDVVCPSVAQSRYGALPQGRPLDTKKGALDLLRKVLGGRKVAEPSGPVEMVYLASNRLRQTLRCLFSRFQGLEAAPLLVHLACRLAVDGAPGVIGDAMRGGDGGNGPGAGGLESCHVGVCEEISLRCQENVVNE